MIKKKIFLLLFVLFASLGFSQSADFVTEIINSEAITYEDVAYFCALNLGLVSDDATPSEAMVALDKANVYSMPNNSKEYIPYDALANMLMRTWGIKGGFFYSITKSNRYAFKELQNKGFIPTNVSSKESVSGIEMLNLITRCLEISEDKNE